MTRVMGIDPGIAHLGWGVITSNDDGLFYEKHGTHTTSPKYASSVRVGMTYRFIHDQLVYFKPDVVVTEDVFGHGKFYNGKETAKVIGLIELACDDRGVPCHVWSPSEIKKRVTGAGTAKKDDIALAVMKYLPDAPVSTKASSEHENDALAIAIAFTLPAPLPVRKKKDRTHEATVKSFMKGVKASGD